MGTFAVKNTRKKGPIRVRDLVELAGGDVTVSTEAGNIIEVKDDGLYAQVPTVTPCDVTDLEFKIDRLMLRTNPHAWGESNTVLLGDGLHGVRYTDEVIPNSATPGQFNIGTIPSNAQIVQVGGYAFLRSPSPGGPGGNVFFPVGARVSNSDPAISSTNNTVSVHMSHNISGNSCHLQLSLPNITPGTPQATWNRFDIWCIYKIA